MTYSERNRFIRSRFNALSKARADEQHEVDEKVIPEEVWTQLSDKAHINPIQDENRPEEDQRSA